MSDEAMHWYKSKIDWWIALLLCVPPVTSVAVVVAMAIGAKTSDWPWALGSILFVIALYGGLVFPLKYGLDDAHLLVRFGVCRQRIPLTEVSEVYPTHNPLSSPALSLDRLHVQYGPGVFKAVMISPADRDGFLNDLAQKAGLKRDGDRLIRR